MEARGRAREEKLDDRRRECKFRAEAGEGQRGSLRGSGAGGRERARKGEEGESDSATE